MIAYASPRPDWAIGFVDQVWWSRFALPHLHAWQNQARPIRLVEQLWKKMTPIPKRWHETRVLWQEGTLEEPFRGQIWLRFVTGRPVSAISIDFLKWCCHRLAAQGKRISC